MNGEMIKMRFCENGVLHVLWLAIEHMAIDDKNNGGENIRNAN